METDRTESFRVAVIDDEPIACREMKRALEKDHHLVEIFPDGESALARMERIPFDLVVCDLKLPGENGLQVLRKTKERNPGAEFIIVTGHSSVDSAIEAIRSGAFHYVTKPIRQPVLRALAGKALEKVRLVKEKEVLKKALYAQGKEREIIGHSPAMQEVFSLVQKLSPLNCNVLIQGESGTGKELAANAVHYNSQRNDKPLMKINCSAIPDSLLESELFGYEKGAFTDAKNTKKGLFELADGGTVFLDEIGDMNPFLQSKILRVLENQTFMRVGGEREIKVDIRIIAATNKDLETMVKEGLFRKDLYYRLKVMVVEMPPLRDRLEDILLLSNLFIEENNREYKKNIKGFSDEAKKLMAQYSWPGNVRELKNVIERAMILTDQEVITPKHLPFELKQTEKLIHGNTEHERFENTDDMSIENMERIHLSKVLKRLEWNKSKASKFLGISRATLRAKIKKYNLLDN